MAKTKLTVTCPLGTVTRTTARTYTHVVVVKGERKEVLEARRLADAEGCARCAAEYREIIRLGHDPKGGSAWHQQCVAEQLADGKYALWADGQEARAVALVAQGPVLEDQGDAFALGWCGRLDLARKLAATDQAARYRTVVIVDVATGEVVRS